jgi:hypothetical protein
MFSHRHVSIQMLPNVSFLLLIETRPKNESLMNAPSLMVRRAGLYLLWISVYTWFLPRHHHHHHHQSFAMQQTVLMTWNDCCAIRGPYAIWLARGLLSNVFSNHHLTNAMQCNAIQSNRSLSCAPTSRLCVDLCSVEWIVMSSCELGCSCTRVASVRALKHMRAILVYVGCVTAFFYDFWNINYYTTQARCFRFYTHDLFPHGAVVVKLIRGRSVQICENEMWTVWKYMQVGETQLFGRVKRFKQNIKVESRYYIAASCCTVYICLPCARSGTRRQINSRECCLLGRNAV